LQANMQIPKQRVQYRMEGKQMEKQKQNVVNPSTLSLMAEMVLDEAIRKYRIDQLYKHIDEALEAGDEVAFKSLTSELKKLLDSKITK
jgi:uncharacterized protein YpiB (UPF0302 family)